MREWRRREGFAKLSFGQEKVLKSIVIDPKKKTSRREQNE